MSTEKSGLLVEKTGDTNRTCFLVSEQDQGHAAETAGFIERYNAHLRGREEQDTFPSVYLLDMARDLRRRFANAGPMEEDFISRKTCRPVCYGPSRSFIWDWPVSDL